MKVVLTRDVKDLGRPGDIVNVADGFARNYLYPQKLAVEATSGNLEIIKRKQQREVHRAERDVEDANALKGKLEGASVTITGKTGAGTRLYGSITAQDIADAAAKQLGVSLDKRDIHIEEPIKSTGTFTVPIKLHREVSVSLQVEVIGKGQEATTG